MADEEVRHMFSQWWHHWSTEQKTGLVLFGVCGITAFVLGLTHLGRELREPFLVSKAVLKKNQAFFEKQQKEEKRLEALKQQDTDRDGISDYLEIYQYRTSAYLEDSDSDRLPDAIEVARGSDPNCPEGKKCDGMDPGVGSSTGYLQFSDLADKKIEDISTVGLGTVQASSSIRSSIGAIPPEPTSLSPTEVRAYLIQNKMVEEETLNTVSDEQLMQIYASAYQEAQQSDAVKKMYSNP